MGNALPEADELWLGISGHFDTLSQVINEFVDNSISNIIATKPVNKTILIEFIENPDNSYTILVEDSGSGIVDFDSVLKLGNKNLKNTPLNEHGFGLKHALATADPSNQNWEIYTRTLEDVRNNEIRRVVAPYKFYYTEDTLAGSEWPGKQLAISGTLVKFTCSYDLFNTLQKGIPGNAKFTRCLDYLCEDLGYIYASLLTENGINISVQAPEEGYGHNITPVKPIWIDYYPNHEPRTIKKDLGRGTVEIDYEIGEMAESSHMKYYKRSVSTQGIEIRINGRLLESGIFKEIWNIEKHPAFNHFLGIINIISSDSSRLPVTRTSKNGIRADDQVLINLYNWINSTFPRPKERTTDANTENELIEELAKFKKTHIRASDKHIEPNFEVFKLLKGNVFADLYLYDGEDIVVYEAKKVNANVQDFYQLLMYWDGLVSDGKIPNEGILLATSFSEGVSTVMDDYNDRVDGNENKYNFIMKTWNDEGMDLETI